MNQIADFGRGSAHHKDLERLPVDWERGRIFHCESIVHLEILKSRSYTSFFPAAPVFVK